MPRVAPVLSLVIRPQFKELRGEVRLLAMATETGINAPTLSQLERGERLPRPRDMDGLVVGYGPPEGWYSVSLEER